MQTMSDKIDNRWTQIIIAHYNENLDWTKYLNYPFTIISKSNIPTEVAPNKGYEASSFLQYIIDNYYNLPDICVFVHAHRSDWHHKEHIDKKVNSLKFIYDYYNINDGGLIDLEGLLKNDHLRTYNILVEHVPILEKLLSKKIDLSQIKYRHCAQFYVTKQLILSNSWEQYINMYMFLMQTKLPSYYSARFFEYLWHYIFTSKLVDKE